ncbi:MAG TPA: TIGR03905 family TSCPD domain-containing protein [Ruminococcaceae bacterium]|nr:TIGR03905 family TSCPD domain-containing protein [Oscillospiraceae bacterium]
MKYTFTPKGVCSQKIEIEIENGVIQDVVYTGGCNGNLKGIRALTKGMKVDDVIEKLQGIECGFKGTSCPDQLSRALKAIRDGI